MDTTANRLKQIMEERGLRQIDILNLAEPYCEKYGVKLGRNAISQYVSGKVVPGQDKLFVLAQALHVSEAWLMGFDETDIPSRSKAEIERIDVCNKINELESAIASGRPFTYDGVELDEVSKQVLLTSLRNIRAILEVQIYKEKCENAGI